MINTSHFCSLPSQILVGHAHLTCMCEVVHCSPSGSLECKTVFCCRNKKLVTSGGQQRASLLGARTLLGAPGLTTRNQKLLGFFVLFHWFGRVL